MTFLKLSVSLFKFEALNSFYRMSVNKKEFENDEVTEPFISFKSNDKKENIKFVYDI